MWYRTFEGNISELSKRTFFNKIRFIIFDTIRHIKYGKEYDVNADFVCALCNKDVYGYVLYCSDECAEIDGGGH